MRLKRYIIEITDPTIKRARRAIENNMVELYRILSKKGWNVDTKMVVKIMDGLFKRYNIRFKLDKKGVKSSTQFLTRGYFFTHDGRIEVYIDDDPKTGKFFRRFAGSDKYDIFFDVGRNAFLRNLLDFLSHEIIHREQLNKAGISFINSFNITDDSAGEDYLSDHFEIEAFAQDAAIQIVRGKSPTIMKIYFDYFDIKDSTMKKFLKKVTQYVAKLK